MVVCAHKDRLIGVLCQRRIHIDRLDSDQILVDVVDIFLLQSGTILKLLRHIVGADRRHDHRVDIDIFAEPLLEAVERPCILLAGAEAAAVERNGALLIDQDIVAHLRLILLRRLCFRGGGGGCCGGGHAHIGIGRCRGGGSRGGCGRLCGGFLRGGRHEAVQRDVILQTEVIAEGLRNLLEGITEGHGVVVILRDTRRIGAVQIALRRELRHRRKIAVFDIGFRRARQHDHARCNAEEQHRAQHCIEDRRDAAAALLALFRGNLARFLFPFMLCLAGELLHLTLGGF